MTLKEFAESYLSPPIRERFLYNIRRDILRNRSIFKTDEDMENFINQKLNTLIDKERPENGIMTGFWWDYAPEGARYWSLLYYEIGEKYDIRRSC
jgi:hypothetical protein